MKDLRQISSKNMHLFEKKLPFHDICILCLHSELSEVQVHAVKLITKYAS
jgi:hypothetical protein